MAGPETLRALAELERSARTPFRSAPLGWLLSFVSVAGWLAFAAWLWVHSAWYADGQMAFALALIAGFGSLLLAGAGVSLRAPSALQVLAADPRPPVLFLRSFAKDDYQVLDRPREAFVQEELPVRSAERERPELAAERVLAALGPYVAIGRPGERLPTLGAARLYVPHEHWQRVVWRLSAAARLVVLQVGETPGAVWELLQAVKQLDPRRLLLVVPDPRHRPLGYAAARGILAELLPSALPESGAGCAVRFGPDWRAELSELDASLRERIERAQAALPAPPDLAEAWRLEPAALDAPPRGTQAPAAPAPAEQSPLSLRGLGFDPELRAALARALVLRGLLPRWLWAAAAVWLAALAAFGGEAREAVLPLGAFAVACLWGGLAHGWLAKLFFFPPGAFMIAACVLLLPPAPRISVLVCLAATSLAAAVHARRRKSRLDGDACGEELRDALPEPLRGSGEAEAVAADMAAARPACPRLWLGARWLLALPEGGPEAARLSDLLWYYPLKIRTTVNLIPVGSRHELRLHLRDRRLLQLELPEAAAAEALGRLAAAAPWAARGLDATTMDAWNHDFEAFARMIDEARARSAHS